MRDEDLVNAFARAGSKPISEGGRPRLQFPLSSSIQAEGIGPDIAIRPVKVSKADGPPVDGVTEADLDGRLDGEPRPAETPEQVEARKKESDAAQQLAETDYALYEALNLLKGMIIVGSR